MTELEIRKFLGKANSQGRSGSGYAIVGVFQKAMSGLDRGLDTALGELKRAINKNEIDAHDLRHVTGELLVEFSERLKNATGHQRMVEAGNGRAISQYLPKFQERIEFALRQFDVGNYDPAEPETPLSMTNNVSIGVMSNSVLQQGASLSAKNAAGDSTFSVQLALGALENLERALIDASITRDQRAEIMGDLATIKAQLTKPSPSRTIIAESAKTLRNIAEGIFAGSLTQPAIDAAHILLKALGLASA